MTTNNRVKTKRLTTRQPFFAYLARNKKTRAASGAYFLYKTNRKESKLKFQKQAVLFKVRNIHFFHVVTVVFDCGYDFVDVGVVIADYFAQTRYARRAYFFHIKPAFFFCPYCKLNFPACQQNMNKSSHFVCLCRLDSLFDSIYISFFTI